MYLLIFEDGTIKSATKVTNDDLDACESGYLDVIHISGDEPMRWMSNGWQKVDKIKNRT